MEILLRGRTLRVRPLTFRGSRRLFAETGLRRKATLDADVIETVVRYGLRVQGHAVLAEELSTVPYVTVLAIFQELIQRSPGLLLRLLRAATRRRRPAL